MRDLKVGDEVCINISYSTAMYEVDGSFGTIIAIIGDKCLVGIDDFLYEQHDIVSNVCWLWLDEVKYNEYRNQVR